MSFNVDRVKYNIKKDLSNIRYLLLLYVIIEIERYINGIKKRDNRKKVGITHPRIIT